jgi:predicted porin
MNKKLMAVAIVAAFSPLTALADAAGVTLYGNMNVSAERVTGTGTGDSRSTRLTDSSSRVGIRGAEKLGASGLEGFFQVETLVAPEGNNGNGGAALGWASRNSGVGLRGAFGEVLGGRWDTYYNETFAVDGSLMGRGPLSAFATTMLGATGFEGNSAAAGAVLGSGPGGAAAVAGIGARYIGGRFPNVVRYATPNLAGFQAIATVGAAEPATNVGSNGKRTGLNLRYANGPILGTVSYLREGRDGASSDYNKGVKGGFAFTFPSATKVGLIYEQLTWPTNTTELKRKNTLVSLSQNLGAVDLNATYGKAKAAQISGADLANTGAKYLTLTGAYSFSKRTLAYLSYNKIDNEARAAYDFFSLGGSRFNGPAAGTPNVLGADPKTIHLGVNHSF